MRQAQERDWMQILALCDQLMAVAPNPVAALNRAVAVAEVEGPEVALALVDDLAMRHYYLFHAIRADLLRRLGGDHLDPVVAERCGTAPPCSLWDQFFI
jgi:RNA polymerase sigma-70 factor (ECF subfamily)